MKLDIALMTATSLLIWAGTGLYWVAYGPVAVTFALLYLSVGALHGLSMCADLLSRGDTERGTAFLLWVTQTITWLPWTLSYVMNTLRRVYGR